MSYKDTHERLLEDLAQAMDTRFKNVPLGSVQLQNAQLADVVTIKPSYTRFCLSIYEVKVTRSDFLSDVRSGKWEGYLEHCHRFYFATPSGIVTKDDIPGGAGWICRGKNGWSVPTGSPVYNTDIPQTTLLSMLFLRDRQPLRDRHVDRALDTFVNYPNYREREAKEKQARLLGRDIALAYARLDEYRKAKDEFESLTAHIRREINEALGINDSWPEWDLASLVRDITKKAKEMGIT